MFTGLIKTQGKIIAVRPHGGGKLFTIDLAGLAQLPAIGASIAMDGVCQTAVHCEQTQAQFFAAPETLVCTTLNEKKIGDLLNIEPALRMGEPLDGHWVSGHVDAVGKIINRQPRGDSWLIHFSLPEKIAAMVAPKGSIAIDGISLTVVTVDDRAQNFSVSVIPHTLENTSLFTAEIGRRVNLEADILAKYLARQMIVRQSGKNKNRTEITDDFLMTAGF